MIVIFLGVESTFLGKESTSLGLNLKKSAEFIAARALRKSLFVVCELCRRSLGRLSVFARCFEARYKKGERDDNINKTHFFSLGVLWLFLGSSLVHRWSFVRRR